MLLPVFFLHILNSFICFYSLWGKKNVLRQKTFLFLCFFCAVSGLTCEWTQPLNTKEDKLMKYR